MTDISRLQVQLQVTKLQNKDNPLYQLLHELIGALKDTDTEVKAVSGNSGSTVTNNITNNSYTMQSGVGSSSGGLNVTSTPIFTPPVIPTLFTPGSILFAGISGLPSQDNANLFWDDANNRLGIRTASPVSALANSTSAQSDGTHSTESTSLVWNTADSGGYVAGFSNSHANFGNGILITGGGDKTSARKLIYAQNNDGTPVFVARGDGSIQVGPSGAGGTLLTKTKLRLDGGQDIESVASVGIAFSPFGAASAMTLQQTRGNLAIGTTTFPSTGTAGLVFGDGTALASMGANTAGFYANDVGGIVNMFGVAEDGTVTRLTWGAPQTYTETNVTTDRSFDANATSLDEIADVLGTLIADLRARGQVN